MPNTTKVLRPVHPGEILKEDLMAPLGLSINRLARELRVPVTRISEIVNGKRSLTADTCLRLARYFGTTPEFWDESAVNLRPTRRGSIVGEADCSRRAPDRGDSRSGVGHMGKRRRVMTRAWICALLMMPSVAMAQSDADLIAEATSPLPEQLRDGATVVVDGDDGSRQVLRQGTNAFVCHPDGPTPKGFYVSCSDERLSRSAMTEYRRLREQGLPEDEILAKVSAGVADGSLTPIPSGAMFFALSGPDKEHAELLVVIRVPDATAESTGLPTEPTDDEAWLMFPGTHQAHIMIGSPPYWWSPNE